MIRLTNLDLESTKGSFRPLQEAVCIIGHIGPITHNGVRTISLWLRKEVGYTSSTWYIYGIQRSVQTMIEHQATSFCFVFY